MKNENVSYASKTVITLLFSAVSALVLTGCFLADKKRQLQKRKW